MTSPTFTYVDTFEAIKAKAFHCDPKAQRPLDPNWVARLTREFDPNKLGMVTACKREDGRVFIIDGQHRVAAANDAGRGGLAIPCRLITGIETPQGVRPLTLKEEAALFIILNDSLKVSAAAKFNARITMGDPVALDIMGILKLYGWNRVEQFKGVGVFTIVDTAEKLYHSGRDTLTTRATDGRDALRDALQVISAAWGNGPGVALKPVLAGLGRAFLRNYAEQAEGERDGIKVATLNLMELAKALAEPGGPHVLVSRARVLADAEGLGIPNAVAKLAYLAAASRVRSSAPRPKWRG